MKESSFLLLYLERYPERKKKDKNKDFEDELLAWRKTVARRHLNKSK